jgi:uncharacterized membrane protein YhaH (DUF805 family)
MTSSPEQPSDDADLSWRWFFFSPSGRIARMPFVLATLFQAAVLGVFVAQLMHVPEGSTASAFWSLGFLASALASVWMTVATAIKRLHDMNLPGAVVLCLFVPAVSVIAFLVLCLWPGTTGPNGHGDETNRPKD